MFNSNDHLCMAKVVSGYLLVGAAGPSRSGRAIATAAGRAGWGVLAPSAKIQEPGPAVYVLSCVSVRRAAGEVLNAAREAEDTERRRRCCSAGRETAWTAYPSFHASRVTVRAPHLVTRSPASGYRCATPHLQLPRQLGSLVTIMSTNQFDYCDQ